MLPLPTLQKAAVGNYAAVPYRMFLAASILRKKILATCFAAREAWRSRSRWRSHVGKACLLINGSERQLAHEHAVHSSWQ